MKTYKIEVNGKKIKCQALKAGQKRRLGDLISDSPLGYEDLAYIRLFEPLNDMAKQDKGQRCLQAYRPIFPKPRVKLKAKMFRAWIDEDFLNPSLCPGEGFWRMYGSKRDWEDGRKFIEVEMSVRRGNSAQRKIAY